MEPSLKPIRSTNLTDAKKLLEEAMAFSSHDEIERYVLEQMQKRFPTLFPDAGRVASERSV